VTDKLTVYNLIAHHLGVRRFAALTAPVEARRVIDDFWDTTVQTCLEEAQWNFMLRTIQQDASTNVVPGFGWKYAFPKPSDWVRTTMVSTVETFVPPLTDFVDETNYWFANFTPLFVQYQSDDPQYGLNLGAWTGNFTNYVALQVAENACNKVTGSTALLEGQKGISARLRTARIKAKSNDAMNEGPREMPTGTWARSRRGFLRGVPLPGGTQFDD